jgi:hypothetical protein
VKFSSVITGVQEPTAPSDVATKNYVDINMGLYQTTSLSISWTGALTKTQTLYCTKIGNLVTLQTAPFFYEIATATTYMESSAIPVDYRPQDQISIPIIICNRTRGIGYVALQSTGVMNVYADLASSVFTSGEQIGWELHCTYII